MDAVVTTGASVETPRDRSTRVPALDAVLDEVACELRLVVARVVRARRPLRGHGDGRNEDPHRDGPSHRRARRSCRRTARAIRRDKSDAVAVLGTTSAAPARTRDASRPM